VEKCCAAPGIPDDEDGRIDIFSSVSSKEDVVKKKTEPDRQLQQGKAETKGYENSDAPCCPPAVGQPEVHKPKKAFEIEIHGA
jgi:hypothetical protein